MGSREDAGVALEWDCAWPRWRRCTAAAWSSSANGARDAGRFGLSSLTGATMAPSDVRDALRSPERLTVLVVDDHDVVHWGFRLMLSQRPWVARCLVAHTGREALSLVRRYRPHVALVDLFLGEESGAEVCEQLREAEPVTRV